MRRKRGSNSLHIEKNSKGMSLIEVIIVLVVAGIIMGVLYQIFITGHFIYSKSKYEEDLIQNARVAMDWIGRDVREADSIAINQGELTITQTATYTVIYKPMDSPEGSKVLGRGIIKNGSGPTFNPVTSPDTYLDTCDFKPIYSTQSPSLMIGVDVTLRLYPYNVAAKKIVKSPVGTIRSFELEGKVYVKKLILNFK